MCLISSTELEILRLVANTKIDERKLRSFKKQEAKSSWEESLQSSVPGGFNELIQGHTYKKHYFKLFRRPVQLLYERLFPLRIHIMREGGKNEFLFLYNMQLRKLSERQRTDAFELRCWRRLLRVPWTARRSNKSILKEISPGYLWKEWC